MIARSLLDELQQLNREEKIQVIQFLNDELSDDPDRFPTGARVFKTWPTIASEETISTFVRLGDEPEDNG